jgi:hypothetical protein
MDSKDKLSSFLALLNNVRNISGLNEANTKSSIVVPILQELQWNVRSPFEVVLEYTLDNGTVDYALKIFDEIKVLLEIKKIGENLDKYENQIKKYAIDKNVYLFILSDGLKWQFYTWLEKGIEIFKFHILDIKTQELKFVAQELINILSKGNIISNRSYNYIRTIIEQDTNKLALYEQIINIWHKIIDEPHPSLCNLIIEKVKIEFGKSARIQDVIKILNAYRKEFDKIRGTIQIDKQPEMKPAHVVNSQKVRHVVLHLKNKLRKDIIPIRDIMPRVFRQMSTEDVEKSIQMLCSIGFCELVGRKVKVLDERAGR